MQIEMPQQVAAMMAALEAGGFEACIVGGCVRDQLLGAPIHDWDLASSAPPQAARALLVARGARVIDTGLRHGTLTAFLDNLAVEVTTYRTEGPYLDARRPSEVSFSTSLVDDLARRDFTMNALAFHPARGLVDPFGGQADIQAKLIRTVGDVEQRLGEDALRVLRALRFASVLGFAFAPGLAEALHRAAPRLAQLAPERLQPELMQLLKGDGVCEVLLGFPDVLAVLIPEIAPTIGFEQHTPYHCYDVWEHTARAVCASAPEPLVRLTLLMHDLAKPQTFSLDARGRGHFYGHNIEGAKLARERLGALRFDRETIETVAELIRWHQENIRPENLLRWLSRLGEQRLRLLLLVKLGDMAAHASEHLEERMARIEATRQAFEELLASEPCFRRVDLAVDGSDLIEVGFVPGKQLGLALDALLDAVIEGRLPNERAELLTYAQRHHLGKTP
jgi:tRNA nucleotidyltransferase (CCA-adding enzyme)